MRTPGQPLLLATLFLVSLAAIGCSKPSDKSAAPVSSGPVTAPPEGGVVHVTADAKGFTPTEIHATKGAPLTLVFTRTSDNTCAKEVVFPEIKLRRPLPLDEAVPIAMPTQIDHVYKFQCGMAMWEGAVVIK